MKKLCLLLSISIFLIGFLRAESAPNSEHGTEAYTVIDPEAPLPRGDRTFGITVSESKHGFMSSFETARKAGIEVVEINLPWNYFETDQGEYHDPEGYLESLRFYTANGIQVTLSFALINTVAWEVPGYLEGVAPNDPEFLRAFEDVIDWIFSRTLPEVDIAAISIGNEVDLVLGGEEQWLRYREFYEAAADYIRTEYPGIRVGVKTTVMEGLFGAERDEIQSINRFSDVVMLNYYPQGEKCRVKEPAAVHEDFKRLVSLFPGREIWMTEVGYQSGAYCNSSEKKQAEFFHHLFTAWDRHDDSIKLVQIDWLHDQSPETIKEWKGYYGSDPALVEFLSTLGLRNYDGSDKPAWLQVKREAKARGWGR
ncbi:MAG: hypothetical protein ACOCYA_01120 [Spirochaetota bacterium]